MKVFYYTNIKEFYLKNKKIVLADYLFKLKPIKVIACFKFSPCLPAGKPSGLIQQPHS